MGMQVKIDTTVSTVYSSPTPSPSLSPSESSCSFYSSSSAMDDMSTTSSVEMEMETSPSSEESQVQDQEYPYDLRDYIPRMWTRGLHELSFIREEEEEYRQSGERRRSEEAVDVVEEEEEEEEGEGELYHGGEGEFTFLNDFLEDSEFEEFAAGFEARMRWVGCLTAGWCDGVEESEEDEFGYEYEEEEEEDDTDSDDMDYSEETLRPCMGLAGSVVQQQQPVLQLKEVPADYARTRTTSTSTTASSLSTIREAWKKLVGFSPLLSSSGRQRRETGSGEEMMMMDECYTRRSSSVISGYWVNQSGVRRRIKRMGWLSDEEMDGLDEMTLEAIGVVTTTTTTTTRSRTL
ncbi:hypothetical protein AMATHDRAFT_63063 [Amanita thiersii Skay4041]|uniref:Uncharacterized protein n=1 Tax=Amanita thiersii Skay4041 TaxID=703135 RepID=A0A2A9NER3_9AGAR|nr:hypothetical protein AMATHDRAFT_63063 [Amanita thiersii Skay4041]